jgi:hypothetical protein
MPIVEEPFDPVYIEYTGATVNLEWIRVGYFSTSERAPVLDLRIDWLPADDWESHYEETVVTVVLANPQLHTNRMLLANNVSQSSLYKQFYPSSQQMPRYTAGFFTTMGNWVGDGLLWRGDRSRTWRYTFYALGRERRYTRTIIHEMWDQVDGRDWAVYAGVVTREIVFGEAPDERGRTWVKGEISVAICRQIQETLVLIDVSGMPFINWRLTDFFYRTVVVQEDEAVDRYKFHGDSALFRCQIFSSNWFIIRAFLFTLRRCNEIAACLRHTTGQRYILQYHGIVLYGK